jgi:PAS domain S-box-containing protein
LDTNQKAKYAFRLLLLVAILFILVSVFFISRIDNAQREVNAQLQCINQLNEISDLTLSVNNELQRESRASLSLIDENLQKIKLLSSNDKTLQPIIGFIDKIEFEELQRNNESIQYLKQKAAELSSINQRLLKKCRNSLHNNSNLLFSYWAYTHYIVWFACLITILLVFIGFFILKTKQRLEEQRSKNKLLFDNSINCVILSDEQGRIVEYNKAAARQFGYSFSEIKHKGFHVLYNSKEELETVKKSLMTNGVFSGEIINRRKDGSLFVSFLSANLIYNNEGEVVGSMGISRDITRQKEKDQEFENIINNAQDIIYTLDVEGNFTFANYFGSKVMGHSKEELLGKPFTNLVHPSHVANIQQFFADFLKGNENRSYIEFLGVYKSDEKIWMGQNVTKLFSPTNRNEVIGFQGVIRNISQQKEDQEKLKKSEADFRRMVNTINDFFYLYDSVNERYDYVSPNAEEVLGVATKFFYSGRSFFTDYVHKDDLDKILEAENNLKKGLAYDLDCRIVVDEQVKWIRDRSFPIRDDAGNVIGYSGVSSDITKIKEASEIIKKQNDEIKESIRYAKNIQESMLPTINEIKAIYENCFVLFMPRDNLSGDFYVIEHFKSHLLGNVKVFAVGDCTGHGVPGGMLSFLCNSLLRESFMDYEVNTPADSLEFVRDKLSKLFYEEKEKRIQDGMDIALAALDESGSTLYFSGANLSLILIRNGQLIEYTGDKQCIGFNYRKRPFNTDIIDVKSGDLVYLFSDGYQDQFGHKTGKKLLKRRLREYLLEISDLSIDDQYEELKLRFTNWKGSEAQVDDVTMMGIKI